MKETTKMTDHIYKLWSEERLTFAQIAQQKIPSSLSLKRIRNIIYGGKLRLKSDHEKEIYYIYRMKFLELKSVNKAIYFAYENQPPTFISERNVRIIINNVLKKKNLVCN